MPSILPSEELGLFHIALILETNPLIPLSHNHESHLIIMCITINFDTNFT